jgi:ubiquinone/menaquinone biosynthesis C-methylase UbiE
MQTDTILAQPHSAQEFGPQRDFWWHRDFLDLMAARWELAQAGSLADIGCGQCHWSRLLYRYLKAPGRFTGVDREARWLAEGEQRFRRAFPRVPEGLLNFLSADATKLPLPDNHFDVVTCQTLLMHLEQPLAALREMLRILTPGGLLVCVEPNNLWNYLAFNSTTVEESVEVLVRRFEFWVRYHRAKKAAGQGDHCIGDLLPGYFAQLGLTDIAVYQSDRAAALFPPYASPVQRALLDQEVQFKRSQTGPWDREELSRRVLATGANKRFFEIAFDELLEKYSREQQAIAAGTFHGGFGSITYLVSGRKPIGPDPMNKPLDGVVQLSGEMPIRTGASSQDNL